MAANDTIFRLQGVVAVAHTDLLSVDPDGRPRHNVGDIGWSRDGFGGLRMFSYRKNESGSAIAAGELASRKRNVITNQTGTTTTGFTASSLGTDGLYNDALFIVHDDAGGAGGAPEGEASIVASHTDTVGTFYADLPLSTALAANDDVTLISPHLIDAADGDFCFIVCGVAMAAPADEEYSWFQFQGVHPRVQHKTTGAVAAGAPIVADAAAVGDAGSDVANLWVGYQIATHGADALQIKSPVFLNLMPSYM